jgi:hypothetical protein
MLAVGHTQPSAQRVPAFFPGVKESRCEVDHSPPCCAEVKNEWSYTSTPHTRIHGVEMENFVFFSSLFADNMEILYYYLWPSRVIDIFMEGLGKITKNFSQDKCTSQYLT